MNAQIKQYLDDQSSSLTYFAKRFMDVSIENDDLKKEVKKLQKALRFYQDEHNYDVHSEEGYTAVEMDRGSIAGLALKEGQ